MSAGAFPPPLPADRATVPEASRPPASGEGPVGGSTGDLGNQGDQGGNAEQRLDGIVVVYWLVSGLLSALVLSAIAFTLAWYATQKWPELRGWLLGGVAVFAGLLGGWALLAPPLAYARWRFAVGAVLLRMRSGIVFHEEKVIPISRLQHVDLLRGPIERLFGLATLVVWTAGNEGASFRLQGLRVERAAHLRDIILAARGDDVV